ncbi:MAG: SAM-dependent methyltransferase [Candidatus Woesearchaeota archaeon]|nr:SAM-dependent methyltransferase [Candidatus Woesearchaeota archaeon]
MTSSLYLIEHLEPKLWPWCKIEYAQMARDVGIKNLLISNCASKMRGIKTTKDSVRAMNFSKPCILDPVAVKMLTPEEARLFETFIFGGILGDDPPRERTAIELDIPGERRNLGKLQMSTDTAVRVVWEIANGKRLKELDFVDGVIIPIQKGEEILLPYRYLVRNGKPVLARGLKTFLKKNKGF